MIGPDEMCASDKARSSRITSYGFSYQHANVNAKKLNAGLPGRPGGMDAKDINQDARIGNKN